MELVISQDAPGSADGGLVAIVVPDPATPPAELTTLDEGPLAGALARELSRGRVVAGKPGVAVVTGGPTGPAYVALLGVGPAREERFEALRQAGARLATTARGLKLAAATLVATGDAADTAAVVEGAALGAYRYDRFKHVGTTEGDEDPDAETAPRTLTLALAGANDDIAAAAARATTIANATNWARDLANCPGNLMYPEALAHEASALADQHEHLTFHSLDRTQLLAKRMGLISAVGQGSDHEPRMIVLEWNPPGSTEADEERLCLVGKAVTFDTGGISIKPSAGMAEMRLDKSGGCAVLGGMRAIAELGVPRRILAVVGSAENMPSGHAYKPGDVITAYDGTTVEVTNTDAEGRLVLGDAIAYARELGCARIVEFSTLTGAMMISLGDYFTGAVARPGELTDAVLAAAKATGDHAWHMPMHDGYKPGLKSEIADMANSGPRLAGALYAGLFLEHFAKDTPFVHCDIAGTGILGKARGYYTQKGASGWGVRLIAELASSGA